MKQKLILIKTSNSQDPENIVYYTQREIKEICSKILNKIGNKTSTIWHTGTENTDTIIRIFEEKIKNNDHSTLKNHLLVDDFEEMFIEHDNQMKNLNDYDYLTIIADPRCIYRFLTKLRFMNNFRIRYLKAYIIDNGCQPIH